MNPTNLRVTPEHMSAAESVLSGRSSITVLAAMSPQQPDALMRAVLLAARRRDVQLTFLFADLYGTFAFLDADAETDIKAGLLRLVSLAGTIHRRWSKLTDYLPYSLWDIDRMLAAGTCPVDLVLAQVCPGDRPGQVEFGDMIGYTASALATKAMAVFEVTSQISPTLHRSAASLRLDRAQTVLRSDAEAGLVNSSPTAPSRPTSDVQEIGRLIASLVPDEATLQLGLGSVAEALAPHLRGKRGLGVHSGIIGPSLNELIASGAITGSAKSKDAGVAVATGVFSPTGVRGEHWGAGSELRPISATHNPRVLSEHDRLWAINSGLEVDLAGQVNAEFVDGTRIASGGGQTDFARAAHASDGGASVIALPARTRQGRSRLVPRLASGSLPNLAGQDVDFVVTEFGAARLRGLTASGKADALIAVAHPDDRAGLRSALDNEEYLSNAIERSGVTAMCRSG